MRINSGTGCISAGGEGAPGPDLRNHLVNRHGLVNVNPVCMSTGGGWVGPWDLSRSLKFLIKNQSPIQGVVVSDVPPIARCWLHLSRLQRIEERCLCLMASNVCHQLPMVALVTTCSSAAAAANCTLGNDRLWLCDLNHLRSFSVNHQERPMIFAQKGQEQEFSSSAIIQKLSD